MKTIACIGDSIRKGWNAKLQPYLTDYTVLYDTLNHNGIDTQFANFEAYCLSKNADYVIINDGGLHHIAREPDTTDPNRISIIQARVYACSLFERMKDDEYINGRVYYVTTTPVDESQTWEENHSWQLCNEDIYKYNIMMSELARSYGFRVIDLNKYINDTTSLFPSPDDGIHYTSDQYDMLAEYIADQFLFGEMGGTMGTYLYGNVSGYTNSLEDTCVRSDNVDYGGGSLNILIIRTTADRTAFVKIDASDIPDTDTITSAKLYYKVYSTGAANHSVYKITAGDFNITVDGDPVPIGDPCYSHRVYNTDTWTTGNFDVNEDCDSVADTQAVADSGETIEWEITDLVQDAVDNCDGIIRIAIRSDSTAPVQLHSNEASSESDRPVLIVNTLSVETPPSIVTIDDYIDEIVASIEAITTDNGYSYDIGSVNKFDDALTTYPAVDITYETETNMSDALNIFGMYEVELKMTIKYQLTSTADLPRITVKNSINQVLGDIRALFLLSDSGIYVGNKAAFLSFRGSEWKNTKTNDVFTPMELITTWSLKYQQ